MGQITPQPGIMDIALYQGGESKIEGANRVTKLSSNENPHGASPLAKAAFVEAAEDLALYPTTDHRSLREAIARVNGLDAERIICGAFIANPNNPTGTMISSAEVERLADALPEGAMLVLDGAYAEFVDGEFDAGAALVDERDNVVMTRTFSKIYGLGGLRVGYGYAPTHVIETLKWRDWMAAQLAEVGIPSDPSHANFVLARFKDEEQAKRADQWLRKGSIIVEPRHE